MSVIDVIFSLSCRLKHRGYFRRFVSAILSTGMLLYVVFSVHKLIGSRDDSLLLNSHQPLDRIKQIVFKSVFQHKTINIFTSENSSYLNRIIKDLLEDQTSEEVTTGNKRINGYDMLSNELTTEKPTGDEVENLTGAILRKNNNTADVKIGKRPTETNSAEEKRPETAKNATPQDIYRNAYYNYSKTVITPVNHEFLISNKDFCKKSSPELIIFIPSSPENANKRSAIRSTFGTLSRDRKSSINGQNVDFVVRTIFIIGKSVSLQLTNSVYEESKKHRDIVLVDLIDSYKDLIKKVLLGLKWVNEFCSSALYVMKADDDVFINVAVLTERLKVYRRFKSGRVFGFVYGGPRKVARSGRWAVTFHQYPFPNFPDYMSGTSYTLTIDLVPKILYTAMRLPLLPIEDAFITGVIAKKIQGAELVHWEDNSRWTYFLPNPCYFKKGYLSMTNMSPQLVYESWKILNSNGTIPAGIECVCYNPLCSKKLPVVNFS